MVLLFAAAASGCATAPRQAPLAAPAEADAARFCLQETGSRIRRADGRCIASPGVVLTRSEVQGAGASLDQALGKLLVTRRR